MFIIHLLMLLEERKAASLGVRFGSDGNGYRYAELPKIIINLFIVLVKRLKKLKILEIL